MSKQWQNNLSNSNSFDGSGDGPNSNGSGGGSGSGHLLDDDDDEDDELSSSESTTSSSDQEEPGFFVKIETIMGNKFQIYAYPSDTVELLKTRIAFQEGIPQKDQNLFLSHGRISLNNPATLLSDLGLNEATSPSKPIRLITNISSGLGSKGFTSRDLSPPPPPPPPHPQPQPQPQLPFLPYHHPLSSSGGGGGQGIRDRGDSIPYHSSSTTGSKQQHQQEQDVDSSPEPFHLPRLGPAGLGLEEDDIDGVIIFKNREDRRVYVIIKKKPEEGMIPSTNPVSNNVGVRSGRRSTARSTATMTSGRGKGLGNSARTAGGWILQNDVGSGRRQVLSGRRRREEPEEGDEEEQEACRAEMQKQVDRIRENAKTLMKMSQIRKNLLLKKKILLPPDHRDRKLWQDDDDDDERENHLPDINQKDVNNFKNIKNRQSFKSSEPKMSTTSTSTRMPSGRSSARDKIKSGPNFSRTVTSSIASLNRLKAEIYLEARKTGGGSFGVLPYTDFQLLRYVQLKVKVLLALQNPVEYDYLSPQRFVQYPEPKCIIPTVVVKREQEEVIVTSTSTSQVFNNGQNNNEVSTKNRVRDSSTSTSASDVSILRENTNSTNSNMMTRLVTARNLSSDDSINKSGRSAIKRQKSQTALKSGGVSVRSIRSSGRRPLSGKSGSISATGTNATIQKKKKDNVRCSECRKRIGIASRYPCRCGKIFCSTHRYAETHNCTYDYKTEGRRQLSEANPLIVASKVDKI